MPSSMNDGARPNRRGAKPFKDRRDEEEVVESMETWLLRIWDFHDEGYVFVAAKNPSTRKWHETAIPIDARREGLRSFLKRFPRQAYDLYVCPNVFSRPFRLGWYALPTPWAWCDIDAGDPDAFRPEPNLLWKTVPSRGWLEMGVA
jgi:hypothetical protein